MLCWPVYLVGGFFISLLLVDLYLQSWKDLGYHAGLGVCFTGLYYLFCLFFGNDISMAILFVPAVFILMFMVSSWLLYKNIQSNNCCMTCNPPAGAGAPAPGAGARAAGAAPFVNFSNWLLQDVTSNPTNPVADFWNWLFSDPPKKQCSKAT